MSEIDKLRSFLEERGEQFKSRSTWTAYGWGGFTEWGRREDNLTEESYRYSADIRPDGTILVVIKADSFEDVREVIEATLEAGT